jgi:hypothetical protein
MRSLLIAALGLALTASQVPAQIVGYFGPVKGTVADPREFGQATSIFMQAPDGRTICALVDNTYGPSVGDPYIEVTTQQINSALHLPGGVYVPPDSPINCRLMSAGTCIRVAGHVNALRDEFGQTYIVDVFSLPASCP